MKQIIYNIPFLEISVSLYTIGWHIIINKIMYAEKKRLDSTWYEREGSNDRIYLQNVNSGGYSIRQERPGCFEYATTCTSDKKEVAINALKNRIIEAVTRWNTTLSKMIENKEIIDLVHDPYNY